MIKKGIGLIMFGLIGLLSISPINADLNIDFKTCHINDATCNVKHTDLTFEQKQKLDNVLTKFYTKIDKQFHSYKDSRYLYYRLLQRIKAISARSNYYDAKNKMLYYIYYNFESEYYKVNNALVMQERLRNERNKENVTGFLNEIKDNNTDNNNSFSNSNNTNKKEDNKYIKSSNGIKISPEKNTTNDSFSRSKRVLQNNAYNGKDLQRKTIYCGCDYDSKKYVDNKACGYVNDGRHVKRGKKIEWEHVVPAENFGRSFKEWRDGDEKCIDSKGRKFKGRKCAEKVNKSYRFMQADIYNLYPAIGALNALRSNYQIAEIPGEKRNFGKCDMEIENRKMEPPKNMKGDIARVYAYMAKTYPGTGIISNKNKKLLEVWNKIDPISKDECRRYHTLKKIQKNINVILEEPCKLVK